MYFFQDDIGLLLQHTQYNFWQFLILPQAEHFAPLLHLLTYIEYKIFHLNFYGYFFVSLALHLINLNLLYRILRLLKLRKPPALTVSSLFIINLTFVEPLLWFSAQGVILANIFIALTFYFWLLRSPLVYLFLILSSFSYSTGVGLGIIFAILSLIFREFNFYFFILGLFSIFVGPLVTGSGLCQITPVIRNPFTDILLFSAFVIGGVGRGVFGRLILPGFEPRHFEIGKTILSFLPFAIISALVVKILVSAPKKITRIFLSLSICIVYPYIWAGVIRYHFGIKQAMAERYAYTPLFFTVILISVLLKYFFDKKILYSKNILAFLVFILLIFQTINFHKKAVEFEIRPLQTKKYIEDLRLAFEKKEAIVNSPLPFFINQPLTVLDLLPLFGKNK